MGVSGIYGAVRHDVCIRKRVVISRCRSFHEIPSLADDRQGSGNAAGYGINDNGEENSEETNDAHLDSDAEQHATCSRGDDTRWLSSSDLQRSSALFLLGMKEKHQLTQVALVGVIRGVTSLMQNHLSALQADINQLLVENGTSQFVIQQLNGLFSENGSYCLPFVGLETQHQQLQYYRTNFQFIVSYTQNYLSLSLYMYIYMYI